MQIRKAERRKAKLRLALCGVSGSGKTYSALKIAKGMSGKTVVIDTENGSADLYCQLHDYDVLTLNAPFSIERYIEAIKMCEKAGYDIIIIDSYSHAWVGSGGILDEKNGVRNKNDFAAWATVMPKHERLIQKIIQSNAHIIACMRSKAKYEIVMNSSNKMTPVKIGLAPIQREGTDHEFTIVLDIDKDTHMYYASKDRTGIFEGKNEIVDESVGERLIEWLEEGFSRDDLISDHVKRIESSQNMDELKSAWAFIYNDNLLNPELEKLTKLKDSKKIELENLNEDINM